MGGLQQRCLWEVVTPRLSGAASLNGEQRADVCVIGAGFTGLSAALHLLEAGRSVCVLEAYEVGHGGSGRNVGLINAGTWIPRTRWSPPSAPSRRKAQRRAGAGAGAGDGDHRTPRHRLPVAPRGHPAHVAQRQRRGRSATPSRAVDAPRRSAGVADRRGLPRGLRHPANQRGVARPTRRHSQSHGLFARTGHRRRTAGRATVPALAGARPGAAGRAVGGAQRRRGGTGGTGGDRLQRLYRGRVDQPEAALLSGYYYQVASAPLHGAAAERILPHGQGSWDTRTVLSSIRRDAQGRLLLGSLGNGANKPAWFLRQWADRIQSHYFPDLGQVNWEYSWTGCIAFTPII